MLSNHITPRRRAGGGQASEVRHDTETNHLQAKASPRLAHGQLEDFEDSWQMYLACSLPIPPYRSSSGLTLQHAIVAGKVSVLILMLFFSAYYSLWNLQILLLIAINAVLLFYCILDSTLLRSIACKLKISLGSFIFDLLVVLLIDGTSPLLVMSSSFSYPDLPAPPNFILWSALASFWCGIIIMTGAGLQRIRFRDQTQAHALVNSWFYAFCRSPGGVGLMLIYFAVFSLGYDWLSIIIFLVWSKLWAYPWIAGKDQIASRKFNEKEWREYASETPLLLPLPFAWIASRVSFWLWMLLWGLCMICAVFVIQFPGDLETAYWVAVLVAVIQCVSGALGILIVRLSALIFATKWRYLSWVLSFTSVVLAYFFLIGGQQYLSPLLFYAGAGIVISAFAVGCTIAGAKDKRIVGASVATIAIIAILLQAAWAGFDWKGEDYLVGDDWRWP